MISWIKQHSKIIERFWMFFTTAATLFLGISHYMDSAALDRLDGREKLDAFMYEFRKNYNFRCIGKTEILRPVWQSRFDTLIDVAKVDTSRPPYDLPCKKFTPPNPASISFGSMLCNNESVKYNDFESFLATKDKIAIIRIGDVPITLRFEERDFTDLKIFYDSKLDAIEKCESEMHSKKENTFINVECYYCVGGDYLINLYPREKAQLSNITNTIFGTKNSDDH
ncbi:MAG: hypothetical protein AB2823_11455 [Candidatus Thiodiazotropha endolucinida]